MPHILADFVRIMALAPILPAPLWPLQRLLVRAAVQITPEPVRSLSYLRGWRLRPGEGALVRAAALLPLGDTPSRQAAKRLAQPTEHKSVHDAQ